MSTQMLANVSVLKLMDLDGTLRLAAEGVGAICDLTDHEAGTLGSALVKAAGSEMRTEVEIRNQICDLSLRRAQSTDPILKERVAEEISTLNWVLGLEEPFSNVWENEGTVFAFAKGDVYRKDADAEWAKCKNSDKLNEARARAMLDRTLAAIQGLGLTVTGQYDGGYLSEELRAGDAGSYTIGKPEDL